MTKPIAPGCLVLVLKSPEVPEAVGHVYTAVRSCDDYSDLHWVIDCRIGLKPEEDWACPYWVLMRIDDPDIQKQIESEQEKEHA